MQYTYKSYKGRVIDPSRKVRIYRNLNNGLISIKQGAYVIGHTEEVMLSNVSFLVVESLRQKVLREKRKSVHAYIEGIYEPDMEVRAGGEALWYNPYLTAQFRTKQLNESVQEGEACHITSAGDMTLWR